MVTELLRGNSRTTKTARRKPGLTGIDCIESSPNAIMAASSSTGQR
jgi:hypothetical protein